MKKVVLSTYDWVYGSAELAVGFLSIIAGLIAISMLMTAHKRKYLRAWRYLIIGLVFFTAVEIVGGLKTFGVYSTPHLTHVLVSAVLVFLIGALAAQINVNRGWLE